MTIFSKVKPIRIKVLVPVITVSNADCYASFGFVLRSAQNKAIGLIPNPYTFLKN